MALEAKIKTLIETKYPDATYALASRFRANINSFSLEPEELPLIILDNELPKNNEIKKNNNILKDTKVVLWFLNQDTPDNTDEQTNAIQAAMEIMADYVAFHLYLFLEVRPQGNQIYRVTPLFHIYNTDLSGVALEMNINENTLPPC